MSDLMQLAMLDIDWFNARKTLAQMDAGMIQDRSMDTKQAGEARRAKEMKAVAMKTFLDKSALPSSQDVASGHVRMLVERLGERRATLMRTQDDIEFVVPLEKVGAEGGLSIFSHPMGAEGPLNGTTMGRTPAELTDIEDGRYTITMQKKGYQPFSTRIDIEHGDARLVQLVGARLMPNETPQSGWSGMALARAGANGLAVIDVLDESPAALAGVHKGDMITAVDGEQAGSAQAMKLFRESPPGAWLTLTLKSRNQKVREVKTRLGEKPASDKMTDYPRHKNK